MRMRSKVGPFKLSARGCPVESDEVFARLIVSPIYLNAQQNIARSAEVFNLCRTIATASVCGALKIITFGKQAFATLNFGFD
jgi:hypothetical protein